MVLASIGLIGGIIALVWCADKFVAAAVQLGRYWHIPTWVVGVTVVAFGTSLPEFVVNIASAITNHPDLAIGTVVGSNVINVLFIIGTLVIICPAVLKSGRNYGELMFMLIVALVSSTMFWQGEMLSRVDGLVLLALFAMYSLYLFKKHPSVDETAGPEPIRFWRVSRNFLLALVGLAVAGHITTQAAVQLAELVGLSQAFISLTIIGFGTSLPEFATSAVAAWRKQAALSLGNIVGSFTLNIVIILGFTSLIQPLQYNAVFNRDVYFMIGSVAVLIMAVVLEQFTPLRRSLSVLFLGTFVYYFVSVLNAHLY